MKRLFMIGLLFMMIISGCEKVDPNEEMGPNIVLEDIKLDYQVGEEFIIDASASEFPNGFYYMQIKQVCHPDTITQKYNELVISYTFHSSGRKSLWIGVMQPGNEWSDYVFIEDIMVYE